MTGNTRTFVAGGSIDANKALRLSTTVDNKVHHNTSATTVGVGVALHGASVNEAVTVQMDGTAKCVAGRAITKGALLAAGASGKVVHTTTANNKVFGIALEAVSSTAGTQVFEVDLTPRGSNY